MTSRYTPPRIIITIPYEGAPYVQIQCDHEADERRIRYWLTTKPDLEDIVDRALQLDRRRAA